MARAVRLDAGGDAAASGELPDQRSGAGRDPPAGHRRAAGGREARSRHRALALRAPGHPAASPSPDPRRPGHHRGHRALEAPAGLAAPSRQRFRLTREDERETFDFDVRPPASRCRERRDRRGGARTRRPGGTSRPLHGGLPPHPAPLLRRRGAAPRCSSPAGAAPAHPRGLRPGRGRPGARGAAQRRAAGDPARRSARSSAATSTASTPSWSGRAPTRPTRPWWRTTAGCSTMPARAGWCMVQYQQHASSRAASRPSR